MYAKDRERLLISIVLAIAIHVVVFIIVGFADWTRVDISEYSGPVFINLPETEEEEPPEEEEPEPELPAERIERAEARMREEDPAPVERPAQEPETQPQEEELRRQEEDFIASRPEPDTPSRESLRAPSDLAPLRDGQRTSPSSSMSSSRGAADERAREDREASRAEREAGRSPARAPEAPEREPEPPETAQPDLERSARAAGTELPQDEDSPFGDSEGMDTETDETEAHAEDEEGPDLQEESGAETAGQIPSPEAADPELRTWADPDLEHRKAELEALEAFLAQADLQNESPPSEQDGPSPDQDSRRGLDPGLLAHLDQTLSRLDESSSMTLRPDTGPSEDDGQRGDASKSREGPPPGKSVPKVGEGRWRISGADPDIDPSDFGSDQPPLVTVILTFSVNDSGLVEPASLKIKKSSGYTKVDRKIEDAVQNWVFMRDEGADLVQGDMTFIIKRSDL